MTRFGKLFACAAAVAYYGAASQHIGLVSTTYQAGVAASGTIRVNNDYGEVNVEGWDRPDVEVTVTRSAFQRDNPQAREAAQHYLNHIKVNTTKADNGDLLISTSFPSRNRLIRLFRGWGDFTLEYRIQVPRHSRLVIREGKGDVVITDVSGDIDARAHLGDIVAQVPQNVVYQLDARCRFGTVYSDLPGTSHYAAFAFGHSLRNDAPKAAHQLLLRVGVGGVSVQQFQSPPEPTVAQ
jgi:hypothetical protein